MKDTAREKLYEAFGELLYMVAIADGVIQPGEMAKLREILSDHPWAEEIQWSFEYEMRKKHDLDALYRKVARTLEAHGPDREYAFFLKAMRQISEASEGGDREEEAVISRVSEALSQQLRAHLKKIQRTFSRSNGYPAQL